MVLLLFDHLNLFWHFVANSASLSLKDGQISQVFKNELLYTVNLTSLHVSCFYSLNAWNRNTCDQMFVIFLNFAWKQRSRRRDQTRCYYQSEAFVTTPGQAFPILKTVNSLSSTVIKDWNKYFVNYVGRNDTQSNPINLLRLSWEIQSQIKPGVIPLKVVHVRKKKKKMLI